jgi:DNA-binding transcriptional MocR family regulator
VPAQYQISGSTSSTIASSIEASVASKAIPPGELLPPIRDLASSLGVSPGTVAAAYRLLGQRGLTASDRRRGTRVRQWRGEERTPAAPPGVSTDFVDLSSGNPDPALLPDVRPHLARMTDYDAATYGAPALSPALADAARAGLAADCVPAEAMTPTFGALDGISRVLSTSLRSGDRVAVEDPGWPSLLNGVRRWGYVPVPVEVDDEGPVPDGLWGALAAGARAVVVTCRAQNPTGAAISAERAGALADLVERYPGVLLVEDDHGHGVAEPGSELHSVVATTLPAGQWAFVRSAAKAYGPDLRLAVIAGDPVTVGRTEAHVASSAGWVSHISQHLVAALWSDHSVEQVVAQAALAYEERRVAMIDALAAEGVPAVGRTGLNVWVPLARRDAADEASSVTAMMASGWRVAAGGTFRLVSGPAIRVTTASLPATEAPRVAHALARSIRSHAPGGY